jgi:hypothetical protein
MAAVASNSPAMDDVEDTTGMMPDTTHDFIMDQRWSTSPLAPPDPLDAIWVGTEGIFHNSEDTQACMMTPWEPWFGTGNTIQSDMEASFPASWALAPISEAAQALPLEMETNRASAGPLPSPPPTSSSSSRNSSAVASVAKSCSCLQHVVFLVHELETAKTASVDGQMASHKEAVEYGQAMVVCEMCSRRPENLMILTFLSDRLLQLSSAMLRRLAQSDGEERPAFLFGELEIDSAPEWNVLVSGLAALQLGALRRLLAQLRKRAETARADMVCKKVVDTERLTGEVMDRLRGAVKLLYE